MVESPGLRGREYRQRPVPLRPIAADFNASPIAIAERILDTTKRIGDDGNPFRIESHQAGAYGIDAGRMGSKSNQSTLHGIGIHRPAPLAANNPVHNYVVPFAI